MILRHFINQASVFIATSTQSRMTTTDSLISGKPHSEGPTQHTVEPEHTDPSTYPISSSTGSHSGSATDFTASLTLAMGRADKAHDPATVAPADDPTAQDTDRGERIFALRAR